MSDGYDAARLAGTVYVRVVGLANMKNTPTLEAFLVSELEDGVSTVCIDLSQCRGMDSTFMGTLVGFHNRCVNNKGRLIIVNPSPGNKRLLDMLGVSAVLPVAEEKRPELVWVRLDATSIDPVKRARMMKQAHEHLIELSAENQAKFGAFLEALEKDLARIDKENED